MRARAAGRLLAVGALCAPLRAQDPTCWSGDFSESLCCGPQHGLRGNLLCWDATFTFERCCGPAAGGAAAAAARGSPEEAAAPAPHTPVLRPGPSAPDESGPEERGLGVFYGHEPGKDCWDHGFTWEGCCDLRHGITGNTLCWATTYSFERCCMVSEPDDQGLFPRPPHLEPPPLGDPGLEPTDPGAPDKRPVGDECWSGGFTFGTCCATRESSCWDKVYTFKGCCRGLAEIPDAWSVEPADSALSRCLSATAEMRVDLSRGQRHCSQGRYLHVARLTNTHLEVDYLGDLPWWRQPRGEQALVDAYSKGLRPMRPGAVAYVGGLCVPRDCDTATAAKWVVPRISPWWRYPSQAPRVLNETHVRIPPPLATQPHYDYFKDAWSAPRPAWATTIIPTPLDMEFAVMASTKDWSLNAGTRSLLLAAVAAVLAASLAVAAGFRVRVTTAVSLQHNLSRLGVARGPVHYDVCRVVLALVVVWIHACDHGFWKPFLDDNSMVPWVDFRHSLNRVNVGFVVLMVELSKGREGGRPGSPVAWLQGVARHALRRLVVIAPMVGVWTHLYTAVCVQDLPVNNVFKSRGLYIWFVQNRQACMKPAHLWPSLLLVHDLVFAARTPCHNADIFEGLFQTDVVCFALCSALGPRRSAIVAAALWVPAVLLERRSLAPDSLYTGAGHRLLAQLPPAFAALALSSWLPRVPAKGALQRAGAAGFAVFCVGAACLQDWFLFVPRDSAAKAWMEALHGSRPEYAPWCHLYELPFVFGLLLLLRLAGGVRDSRTDSVGAEREATPSWSAFRALARLCAGINIANLFVLHYAGGHLYDEPWEANLFSLLTLFLATVAFSAGASLVVFVLVEGPCEALLGELLRGDPARARAETPPPPAEPPAAAARPAAGSEAVQNGSPARPRGRAAR